MTGIFNARILASVAMLVFVGAAIAASTGAFFSDTETSTGNTFTAGDIDLQIDNTSYVTNAEGVLVASPNNTWAMSDLTDQLFFSFGDVKPGDIGEDTISIHPGTNDAYACMAADITATPDNGINEPEGDAGDVTDGDGGELQNFLNFTFWEDDGDNVYETGEVLLADLQGTAADIFDGGWNTIADSANGPALPGNSTTYVGKAWCFGTLTANGTVQDGNGSSTPLTRGTTGFTCDGSGDNNIAQTDGITVDVSFYAVQARNNGQFLCSSLPAFNGEDPEETLVGAALGAYDAPEELSCSEIVENGESIQTAIDGVSEGQTVCVAPSYTGAGDDTPIRISKDNVTVAALTRGIDLDVPVVLDNDGTKILGFTGFVGQAESPSEVAAFYIDGDADGVEIAYNDVTGGTNGVLTETSGTLTGALIRHNSFTGLTRGIFFNPSQNMVAEFNDFVNNTVGIANDEPHNNIIRRNDFEGNTESIGYLDEANGGIANNGVLTVTQNNIADGQVNNYSVLTSLSAENNWWGGNGASDQDNQAGPNTAPVDSTPEALVAFPEN